VRSWKNPSKEKKIRLQTLWNDFEGGDEGF